MDKTRTDVQELKNNKSLSLDYAEFNRKCERLYIIFVDFKKAFDSIKRDTMFGILKHFGIPAKILRAIQVIYQNSKSAVLVNLRIYELIDAVDCS